MTVAFSKLPGLDSEKVLAVVDPILRSHRVEGVELLWVGGPAGQTLRLTIERPESSNPGAGITVDVCAEISRDLSAALDVAEVIHKAYHLEVGSPGVERPLHLLADYQRFAGKEAKLKLTAALTGQGVKSQRTLRGVLFGVEGESVLLETESGTLTLPFENIESARLVFSWNQPNKKAPGKKRPAAWNNTAGKKKSAKKTKRASASAKKRDKRSN